MRPSFPAMSAPLAPYVPAADPPERIRAASRFSVEAEITHDDVLKSGKKVQYSRDATILVERPNRLRVELVGDKGERNLYYDGKTMTVYRPDRAVYAAFDAPGHKHVRKAYEHLEEHHHKLRPGNA